MKRWLLEVALVATPKVAGGVLAVALNAVLMRFLGPAEFGVFALCTAVIMLFDSIVGASVDNSLLKLAQTDRVRGDAGRLAVEQAALLAKLGLWLIAVVALAPFARDLSRHFFHQDGRVALVAIVALASGAVLIFRSLLAHWQIRQRFPVYGALDMAQMTLKFGAIGILLLVFSLHDVEPIIAVLGLAPLCVVVAAAAAGAFPLYRARPVWAEIRRVAGVSKWFLLTFGLSVLLNKLDLLLLTQLSTIGEVGVYSGGQVYAVIPEMIGSLISIVFVPRIYAAWSAGRLGWLARTVVLVGTATAACALALALLLRPTLGALFPPAYLASVEVFLVLLPGYFAAMIAFPIVIPFIMFASPRAIFMLDLLTLPLVAILYAWLIARHGALGAAWAATITRLAKVGLMHVLAWRMLRRSPLPPETDAAHVA